jgi:hypothetical protein
MIRLWLVMANDKLNDVQITIMIHDESEDWALRRAKVRLAPITYNGMEVIEPYEWTIQEFTIPVSETPAVSVAVGSVAPEGLCNFDGCTLTPHASYPEGPKHSWEQQ